MLYERMDVRAVRLELVEETDLAHERFAVFVIGGHRPAESLGADLHGRDLGRALRLRPAFGHARRMGVARGILAVREAVAGVVLAVVTDLHPVAVPVLGTLPARRDLALLAGFVLPVALLPRLHDPIAAYSLVFVSFPSAGGEEEAEEHPRGKLLGRHVHSVSQIPSSGRQTRLSPSALHSKPLGQPSAPQAGAQRRAKHTPPGPQSESPSHGWQYGASPGRHAPSTQKVQAGQSSVNRQERGSLVQRPSGPQRSFGPQSRSEAQPGSQSLRPKRSAQTCRGGQSPFERHSGTHAPSPGDEQLLPLGQAQTIPRGQSAWRFDWQRYWGKQAPARQMRPGRQSASSRHAGTQLSKTGSQASEKRQPELLATHLPSSQT